ncbi:hypothetical protein FQN54_002610 [Arachnomyces sp. PD_36]|nr:hypothetical protein FQN54_002610 [Arachnomyces sp. PD_36]
MDQCEDVHSIGGPNSEHARTAVPFAQGEDIYLDIGDGCGFSFRVTVEHVYQPCTVALVMLVVFEEIPPAAWGKKIGERAILKLYDRRYAFGIRKAAMRGVGDEGLGTHDKSIEKEYRLEVKAYGLLVDIPGFINKHTGVKPSGVKPKPEIEEPVFYEDSTTAGAPGKNLDEGEIYFDEWRSQPFQNREYCRHRAKPYGTNEAAEFKMKFSIATRTQALCLSIQKNEAAMYEKLLPLQGAEIPKFYSRVWMKAASDGAFPEQFMIGPDDFVFIPGILLEYVEGEYLEPMILGVDSVQDWKGASVNVPRDQADKELKKMVKASARLVNKVLDHGVVNEELTDHNLLFPKKKVGGLFSFMFDFASARSRREVEADEEWKRRGGLFPVMFDFALARSRREDETHEQWNSHRWVVKKDGDIDYDFLRERDPTRRRKIEDILVDKDELKMASTTATPPVSVLFVCLGNICRSPMAEAVFRSTAANSSSISTIDSAGTGAYHELDPPDPRTMSTLRKHQISDYDHAARKVTKDDFREFDYILAMDKYNLQDLLRVRDSVISGRGGKKHGADSAAGSGIADVRLFGDFGGSKGVHAKVGGGEEVQDPYYGAHDGFEEVYQQVVRFSKGFLQHVEGLDAKGE